MIWTQDINANDTLNILRSLIRLSGWIVGFYYICQFGGEVTSRFQDLAHSIYDCPWYAMPLKIRKYFPLMIAAAQHPMYLYGCFNIRCIQESFQKVRFGRVFSLFFMISYGLCNFHAFCLFFRLCTRHFRISWFWGKLFKCQHRFICRFLLSCVKCCIFAHFVMKNIRSYDCE